jgi:hypothetical protein
MTRLGPLRTGVLQRTKPLQPARRLVAAFCAVCAEDLPVGSVVRVAPLGRGNGLVAVCADCDTTPAAEARPEWRGYEAPCSTDAIGFSKQVDAAYKRLGIKGTPNDECLSPGADAIEPGFVVCRVPRHVNGRPIDNHRAYEIARRRWGSEIRHVSTTARYHVFQRPEPKRVDERDPLEAIRQWEATP